MAHYHGSCYCGQIKFECKGDPLFTQYCHCNKCREIAAYSQRAVDKRGYSFTAAYLQINFKMLSDESNIIKTIRNNAILMSCKVCQSLIYGISVDPDKQAGIGVNVNNFKFENDLPESFKPARHIWYADRVIDFNDTLPKFIDAPKEQFGIGQLFMS